MGILAEAQHQVYDSAERAHPFIDEFRDLIQYRELLKQFISRAIKTRYKRSVLGVTWTMLNPLLTMLVLTIVFSNMFRFQIEHYPIYILSGLTAWTFFTSATIGSMNDMVWNSSLLQRIFVPKSIFVVSAVGTSIINYGLVLVPMLLIMLITNTPIRPAMFSIPLALLIFALFTMGIGFILATIAVYFADIVPIYEVITMILFYGTAIIFPKEIIPESFQFIIWINPITYMIELFRLPIYQGVMPDLTTYLIAIASAIITLLLGWTIFTSKINEYAYRT
ncbi:MAG: ABC transporter [Anaerolinea sp.]|jgi:ABC-type polysaccharide/polyol phosphate export permease|nr:ABC transporter [Anaerolinea sp.]